MVADLRDGRSELLTHIVSSRVQTSSIMMTTSHRLTS